MKYHIHPQYYHCHTNFPRIPLQGLIKGLTEVYKNTKKYIKNSQTQLQKSNPSSKNPLKGTVKSPILVLAVVQKNATSKKSIHFTTPIIPKTKLRKPINM